MVIGFLSPEKEGEKMAGGRWMEGGGRRMGGGAVQADSLCPEFIGKQSECSPALKLVIDPAAVLWAHRIPTPHYCLLLFFPLLLLLPGYHGFPSSSSFSDFLSSSESAHLAHTSICLRSSSHLTTRGCCWSERSRGRSSALIC